MYTCLYICNVVRINLKNEYITLRYICVGHEISANEKARKQEIYRNELTQQIQTKRFLNIEFCYILLPNYLFTN